MSAIRSTIREVDPNIGLRDIRLVDDIVEAASAPDRFRAGLVGTLAALAFLLAAIGVYGIMAYTVELRAREFAIRVAIGETPSHLRWKVIREAAAITVAGIVIGILFTALVAPVIRGVLFGVGVFEPVAFALTSLGMLIVAMLAADRPARKAGLIDPAAALSRE